MNYTADTLIFTAYSLEETPFILSFPLEFEIVKSFDSPAQSFEGIFPCDHLYPELYRFQVYAQNKKIFIGKIDEQTVTENDQGRVIKLMVRSAGAALLDNEALPRLYHDITLSTMFNNHIKPYGFTLKTVLNPFFGQYQVLKGMSEWEAFSNFFRNSALGTAFIDDENNVVCQSVEPVGITHNFSNQNPAAQHYTNLKITNNRYAPITRFIIRNSEGIYNSVYDSEWTTGLKISRKRYLIPSVEYTYNPSAGELDAALRLRRSMLGKLVITLTCPDLLVCGVCDRVNLDTGLKTYSNLFTQQVRYKLTAGGVSTTLTLLDSNYI